MRAQEMVFDTKKDAIRYVLSDQKACSSSIKWLVKYCEAALLVSEESGIFKTNASVISKNLKNWRHPQMWAVIRKLEEEKKIPHFERPHECSRSTGPTIFINNIIDID